MSNYSNVSKPRGSKMDSNLFNAMFQQSAISMVISKLDGVFLYMNHAFCELLGYKKEELMNETYKNFTHEEDIEQNEVNLGKLINGEIQNYQMEKRYIHKAGHIIWGILSVNLIYDDKGLPLYLMAQVQNITEKKEMEVKLIESEKNYRLIAENAFDQIIVLNEDGKYKYISPAVTVQLGYERGQLAGFGPSDFIYVADKPLFEKAIQAVLKGDLAISITYRAQHKDGHYLWTEANVKCINEEKNSKEILLICRDITQRKKMEKKLNESNERIHNILESISDGFVAIDNEARFIYVNKAAVKILNNSRDKLLGYKCVEVLPEFITTELLQQYEVVKAKKVPVKFEMHSEVLNATYAIRMYPMKDIISIYFLDITEQKNMETWLRKTEKLSLVGQLAAGVAHEIRNPMTSIKGFMQLVKATKEFKEFYIDIILTELERTETIIYEFLSLAKPNETGLMEKTSIKGILEKVIQLLDSQALMQGITIHTSFPKDFVIQCNGNQMKQVFINIIQNAIEASHINGNISISLLDKDNHNIVIRIQDEGCGIPADRLHKLGEPFYSTKEKGTGLGLLVTYKIIEGHKGKLNFASEEGKGTTVDVLLPKRIYTLV